MPLILSLESKKDVNKIPDRKMTFQLSEGEEIERFLAAFPFFVNRPTKGTVYVGPNDEDYAEVTFDTPKYKITIEASYFKTK
jgi:hypothetical protein